MTRMRGRFIAYAWLTTETSVFSGSPQRARARASGIWLALTILNLGYSRTTYFITSRSSATFAGQEHFSHLLHRLPPRSYVHAKRRPVSERRHTDLPRLRGPPRDV